MIRLWFCVFAVILDAFVSGQSPCPDIFNYQTDNSGVYGTILLQPFGTVTSVTIKANFTIAARLQSNYVGSISHNGKELNVLQDFNRGVPIQYRVNFPVTSPLPRLTGLSANDIPLCYGSGDVPAPGQYVTTISLQHSLFMRNGFNGVYNPPTTNFNPGGQQNIDRFTRPPPPIQRPDYEVYQVEARPKPVQRPVVQTVQPRPTRPPYREPEYEDINQNQYPNENYNTPPPRPVIPIRTTTTTQRPRPTPAPAPLNRDQSNECGVVSDSVPLIFQGSSYQRGEWPWLVAIYKKKSSSLSYICSGTLISDQHVITAAHCMKGKTTLTSKTDIIVKVGVFNLEDDWGDDITVTRKLSSAFIHESYNASNLANDILVMTLERSVNFNSNIKPACLWSGNTELSRIVGTTGVVAGWGASETGPGGSGEPRMVRMPVVSTKECRASKPEFHRLTSHKTLCAGDKNGSGPCLGDSGGGLYILDNGRWRLRGVVSLSLLAQNGDYTCNLNEYVVFTDTAQYLQWIKDKMSI
ncbi:unnamed protein product [Leptosia nina]|uniref:Peptidase S1 domain-containing protein n=1 Tax=Leptosia nina TaxID=320188 RepID=A0AAV1IYM2_9NEOP